MKSYYIEINPNNKQKQIIKETIGACRFVYNEMIAVNQLLYQMSQIGYSDIKYMNGFMFSKYLNNNLVNQCPWIKNYSSKAIKQSIMNCDKAFNKFFKHDGGFPKFKKKNDTDVKMYLPKNNKKDFQIKRNRIKIPILKWVKIKEYGYIISEENITSCTISKIANRYFISILTNENTQKIKYDLYSEGIGVDLGVKDLAISSDGNIYKNTNKTKKVKKLEKKLKRESKKLSKKLLKNNKSKSKKERRVTKNIQKNITKIQKIHFKLSNIRTEYVRKVVNTLVRNKPEFITIEDLNIKGMMKNKHLSKAIQDQKFGYFRVFLIQQCIKCGIEVRIANRYYSSSKTCNCCGNIKTDLKLSDRLYICDKCGLEIDRDKNASLNLRDCNRYKIAC